MLLRALSTRTGRSSQCGQPDPASAASAWASPRHRMQYSWVSGASIGPEHSVQKVDMLERREGNPSTS
ncbi:hypothetical protein ABG768_002283, partial [Culter alburnus]